MSNGDRGADRIEGMRSRYKNRLFYPYVVQLGSNREVLFVNYATDVDKAMREFVRRHTHLRDSVLRMDLVDGNYYSRKSKMAERECRRLVSNLEARGYEVIAGGPLMNPYWQLYVIEIDGDARHLYVGETNYPVEKRFQQHVYKFNPARALLKYDNFELAMEHAEGWPKVRSKKESLANEAALAEELRGKGYKVEGGH